MFENTEISIQTSWTQAVVLSSLLMTTACSSGTSTTEAIEPNNSDSNSSATLIVDTESGTTLQDSTTAGESETEPGNSAPESTNADASNDAPQNLEGMQTPSSQGAAPPESTAPTPPIIPIGPAEHYVGSEPDAIADPNNISLSTLLSHPGRIGFGSKATGGLGGRECIVDSLESVGPGTLRNCLENDDPINVKFEVEGTIITHHYILIGNNKTIDGTNVNISISGSNGILCEASSNIIIHNIKFQGLNTGVRLSNGCDTVWLNHLQIDDISDEGIAIVGGATNITVSWTRINKTDKGILIGSDISDTATKNTQITLHHNVLAADQRNPNARYAKVHMFSNLVTKYIYEGTIASQLAEIRSERNAFVAGDNTTVSAGLRAETHNDGDTESGLIWSFEDYFSANSYPLGNVQITSERVGFDIPYRYWAPPISSEDIETLLNRTGWQP